MFDITKKYYKMVLHYLKCLILTKYNNIKVKPKIDEKTNLYFRCIGCGFKNFGTIDKVELSGSLKDLI